MKIIYGAGHDDGSAEGKNYLIDRTKETLEDIIKDHNTKEMKDKMIRELMIQLEKSMLIKRRIWR